MVYGVGILSKGNEETVYLIFSGYQQICGKANKSDDDEMLEEKKAKFKATFCCPYVNVHFSGLFDWFNSVGKFELPFFPGVLCIRSKLGYNIYSIYCIYKQTALKV